MAPARFRFSLRGRRIPGPWGVAGIVLGAAVLGVGAGFLTTAITGWIVPSGGSPSPTVNPSPSPSMTPVIPVDLYPRIDRDLDTDDLYAGLNDLGIPRSGTGVFAPAPGVDEPDGQGPVHWVRVDIEEGLPLTPDALAVYVMSVLNDERGWGANGRMTFARTDGAAEFRIIFASPTTAAALCPRPHEPAEPKVGPPQTIVNPALSPMEEPSPSPSPSSPAPGEPSCATQGMIVINAYRWADGVASFGEDRVSARVYLLNHFLGHALGYADEVCAVADGRASVMVDHEFDISPCLSGPWPNPVTG